MSFKKTTQKAIFLILSVSVLLCSFSSPLFAATVAHTAVQPRWANVASITMVLNLEHPTVSISIGIAGQTNATFTDGVVTLEKLTGYGAGTVWTWENLSSDLPFFHFSDDSVPRTIGTYRLTITINTHGANGTELFTKSMERTY